MWKNSFHLGSARRPLPGVQFFQHIVVLCPTVRHNKTYEQCPWIWTDPEVYLLDLGERLDDYLRAFYHVFMGEPTLYIIDDCSASTALTKKKDMLSMLAFSGRHVEQSVWVLTQLCPEGLARADALGLFVSLQRPRFLRRLSA